MTHPLIHGSLREKLGFIVALIIVAGGVLGQMTYRDHLGKKLLIEQFNLPQDIQFHTYTRSRNSYRIAKATVQFTDVQWADYISTLQDPLYWPKIPIADDQWSSGTSYAQLAAWKSLPVDYANDAPIHGRNSRLSDYFSHIRDDYSQSGLYLCVAYHFTGNNVHKQNCGDSTLGDSLTSTLIASLNPESQTMFLQINH